MLHAEETENGFLFTLSYLESGEPSYANYKEKTNGDVDIIITEGDTVNTITFKEDGTVLYGGVETDVFNPTEATPAVYSPRVAYASYMCYRSQLPGTCDRVFESSVSGEVTKTCLLLPDYLKNLAISTLTSILMGVFNVTLDTMGWISTTASFFYKFGIRCYNIGLWSNYNKGYGPVSESNFL